MVEAADVWLLELELEEPLESCATLELELEPDEAEALGWLVKAAELELAEADADADETGAEVEDETRALDPEAEAEAEVKVELDDAEDATAPDTIRPLPQGIAGPSGCLAKGGAVTAPLASAIANRVVQVGSWPL